MPIQVAGKLIPRNDNTWPVVDDAHIEGGYRVVADLLARNAIDVTTLKVGAAVHVVASQATYRVASIVEGVVTWEDFSLLLPEAVKRLTTVLSQSHRIILLVLTLVLKPRSSAVLAFSVHP